VGFSHPGNNRANVPKGPTQGPTCFWDHIQGIICNEINYLQCGIMKDSRRFWDQVLKEIGIKHGFSLKTGNAHFSKSNFSMKIEGATIVDGEVQSKEREDFKLFAELVGLEINDLGKVFKQGGFRYEIIGYKSKCSKRPVLCKRVGTDQRYKFSVAMVKMFMKEEDKKYWEGV